MEDVSFCLKHYESIKDKTDFTQESISAINIIKELNAKKTDIKKETLVKLLNGDIEVSVLNIGGHLLTNFGDLSFLGREKTVKLVDFLKEEQYISDFGATEGYLYSTNKGSKVLKGEKYIYISEDKANKKENTQKDKNTLLADISKLQEELSNEFHVSKFMIWTQATTKELFEKQPKTIEDLNQLQTLKEKKIKMFGDRIIKLFNGS